MHQEFDGKYVAHFKGFLQTHNANPIFSSLHRQTNDKRKEITQFAVQ